MAAKYPLTVVFEGGRVRHSVREADGRLIALCGKRGTPVEDPKRRPWCAACAKKPNPIDQRTYLPKETD
jgi:hypothetical protein